MRWEKAAEAAQRSPFRAGLLAYKGAMNRPVATLDSSLHDPSDSQQEQAYQDQIQRDLPRNYAVHLIHGLLGQTGFRLVHAPTFVPAYIFLLSGSELAVGLALAAQHLGAALSSIFGATLIEHRKRVLPVGFAVGALMRLQVLGLALSGLFLPPELALFAAIGFLCLFGLFNGMQAVMFNYLLSKVIPVSRRGRLTGLRNFLAGLTASGVAYLGGKYLIETQALGNGYSATFLVAFVLTSIGLFMLLMVREPEPPAVRARSSLVSRFRQLPAMLRADRAYSRFLLARALAAFGTAAAPFYILYAGDRIGLSGGNLGVLSIAFLLAQTTTNLAWGAIADKTGNRFVFQLSLGIWVVSTIALSFAGSLYPLALVFAGLGAGMGGFMITSQNLILEFGAREDLPMRIAVANAATSAMMALGPLVGGLVAATYSYSAVFALAVTVKLAAILTVALWVDEPRKRSTTF